MPAKKILKQAVIGAIFSPCKQQIVLIKRRDVPVWVLPGGGIEPHESVQQACIREVLEETNLTVRISKKNWRIYPDQSLSLFYAFFCLYHTFRLPGAL
jgi:8-oxo-dGTP diphosphatase